MVEIGSSGTPAQRNASAMAQLEPAQKAGSLCQSRKLLGMFARKLKMDASIILFSGQKREVNTVQKTMFSRLTIATRLTTRAEV